MKLSLQTYYQFTAGHWYKELIMVLISFRSICSTDLLEKDHEKEIMSLLSGVNAPLKLAKTSGTEQESNFFFCKWLQWSPKAVGYTPFLSGLFELKVVIFLVQLLGFSPVVCGVITCNFPNRKRYFGRNNHLL